MFYLLYHPRKLHNRYYHNINDSFAIYDFWLLPKKSILHSTKLTIYYFQFKQLHNLRSFDIWYLHKISVEILGVRLMKISLFCHHYVLVLTINKTMFARGVKNCRSSFQDSKKKIKDPTHVVRTTCTKVGTLLLHGAYFLLE